MRYSVCERMGRVFIKAPPRPRLASIFTGMLVSFGRPSSSAHRREYTDHEAQLVCDWLNSRDAGYPQPDRL